MSDQPRIAVVTGAASGIGAATSRELRAGGWLVGGLDLQPSSADVTANVDVTDLHAVKDAIDGVERSLGPIEALVSSAGHYEMAPVDQITEEQWHRMLAVHLGGLVNCTRAVLPRMVERRAGCVVGISSELAIGGGDGDAHYAAAKGAMLGFVRSLALEVAEYGVRINSVAPGPTDTPLLSADSRWRGPEYLATLPSRRLAQPEEVAAVVRFVVEEGSFLVGEVVSVNSGAVI
jgi:2-hydroxycyclohexanecarboxyl-CoA dehydrogenase